MKFVVGQSVRLGQRIGEILEVHDGWYVVEVPSAHGTAYTLDVLESELEALP